MKSKTFICAIIVGLVISIFQGPLLVCASSGHTRTVKVGYYENDLFQEGASDEDVKNGYAYEYYMKLSEYTGWKYEYVYGTFGDLYQKLVDGEIDLLAGLAYREERTEFIAYPDISMGSETYDLIKHEGNKEITSDPESINGHTIGVLESAVSSALEAYLISHELDADIKYYNDMEKLVAAFENGSVDLLATEGAGTLFRKHYEVILTFGLSDYYVCVNKDKPMLLKELNDAQTMLFHNEPYFRSALSSKYFADSVSIQAFSKVEREWVDSHDSVTIGYLNNYLPYCDTDALGNVEGVITEIMNNILSSLNLSDLKVNYLGFDSYDEMIAAVNEETIDAAFPVGGGIYYSEQNGIYQTSPFVSVSTDLIYENVVISPNLATFAVNKNNKMQYYYIKSNYPDAKIEYYESIEECLRAVLNREVDCTTLNGLRSNEILKNSKYSGLYSRQLPAKDDRGIGVKIGNEGFLRLLNRGIHIIGDEYATTIAYKYSDDLYTYSVIDWINHHVLILCAIFLVALIFIISIFELRFKSIREANAKVVNAALTQKNLIDNIAGYLKAPLEEINESSKLALNATDDEAMVKASVNRIALTSGDMVASIDQIIDLNLLEKKKLKLSREKVDIVELIKAIEQDISLKAEDKKINFSVSIGKINNKEVFADGARLTQILTNVLDNAVKYTPEGGKISFSAKEKKSINPSSAEFKFVVKDNGVGMSEEFQAIAFEPFTREASVDEPNAPGGGVGLAVANKLASLMNGTINIKSQKDKGTEVEVNVLCKMKM